MSCSLESVIGDSPFKQVGEAKLISLDRCRVLYSTWVFRFWKV